MKISFQKEDNIFLFNNTNKIRERILIIMNTSKQPHTEILESPPFLSSSFSFLFHFAKVRGQVVYSTFDFLHSLLPGVP